MKPWAKELKIILSSEGMQQKEFFVPPVPPLADPHLLGRSVIGDYQQVRGWAGRVLKGWSIPNFFQLVRKPVFLGVQGLCHYSK